MAQFNLHKASINDTLLTYMLVMALLLLGVHSYLTCCKFFSNPQYYLISAFILISAILATSWYEPFAIFYHLTMSNAALQLEVRQLGRRAAEQAREIERLSNIIKRKDEAIRTKNREIRKLKEENGELRDRLLSTRPARRR
jgi:magnesium-transporting ATPase (P-type)